MVLHIRHRNGGWTDSHTDTGGTASGLSFPWRSCAAYLRQRRLRLGEPEGHVHGAVQRHGSRQFGVGLLSLLHLRIQHAEATVAVRQKRAHTEWLGDGESLAEIGFCQLALGWLTLCSDLTEEPAGMRLIAALCLSVEEFEETSGQRARLVHATNEEQGLTQLGEHKRLEEHTAPGGHTLQRLIQERQGLRHAPGQGIRRTQNGGEDGKDLWEVSGLAQRQ